MDDAMLFADAQMPIMDGPYLMALLSRVVHTTCGATILGGLIYLRFVLAPAVSESDGEATLFATRRQTWARCVALCTTLLLVSGLYNFYVMVVGADVPSMYHMLFGVKFLLALGVFALAALTAGKTSLAVRMRTSLKKWLNLAIVLALAIFLIGAVLKTIDKPRSVDLLDSAPTFDAPALPEL